MADSNTTNHSFILPEIGSSKDTWGAKINDNFTALDTLLRTSTSSVFLPRIGGGNVTGGFIFTAHATYDARIGQTDYPLTVRRKSDNVIAFRFDGAAGIDATAPDARSVMNRAMTDARYIRPGDQTTFTASTQAQLLVAHTLRVLAVRRKSDSLDTHSIYDEDIANPDVASNARSILTRAMGDNRYLKLTGGNTISGTQTHTGQTLFNGITPGVIGIGSSGSTPFYAQRSSDNMVTHVILDTDISAPDDPSHARSILTRTMGDRRYFQKDAINTITAEQTWQARAIFEANTVGRVFLGQSTSSPFYVVRKSDSTITHQVPNDDITNPDDPSIDRSILTRIMGDRRYGTLASSNVWSAFNRFDAGLRSEWTGATPYYVQAGSALNALYVYRVGDSTITHTVPTSDISDPSTPSSERSILTRAMGDGRYLRSEVSNPGPVNISTSSSGSVQIGQAGVLIQTGGPGQAQLVYHYRARNATDADVFRILSTGNVQNLNNSYGGFSDYRLKENVVDVRNQLDDVLALRVVNFNFLNNRDHKQIGLIAQEVMEVKPGLVEEGPDGMLSVKYSVLVPILIKAVQELAEQVASLRNSPVTSEART